MCALIINTQLQHLCFKKTYAVKEVDEPFASTSVSTKKKLCSDGCLSLREGALHWWYEPSWVVHWRWTLYWHGDIGKNIWGVINYTSHNFDQWCGECLKSSKWWCINFFSNFKGSVCEVGQEHLYCMASTSCETYFIRAICLSCVYL